jgi:hypothetical protein
MLTRKAFFGREIRLCSHTPHRGKALELSGKLYADIQKFWLCVPFVLISRFNFSYFFRAADRLELLTQANSIGYSFWFCFYFLSDGPVDR